MDLSNTANMFLLNQIKRYQGFRCRKIGTQLTDEYLNKIYGENSASNFRDSNNVVSYAALERWK